MGPEVRLWLKASSGNNLAYFFGTDSVDGMVKAVMKALRVVQEISVHCKHTPDLGCACVSRV